MGRTRDSVSFFRPDFRRMEDSRGRNYTTPPFPLLLRLPVFYRCLRWGKALFISSSRRPSRLPFRLERTDPLRLSFSLSLLLSTVPRESAAILYIAKSFTISLGTFIILQLNLPCFAAERYPAVGLIYHFTSRPTISTFPRLDPDRVLLYSFLPRSSHAISHPEPNLEY